MDESQNEWACESLGFTFQRMLYYSQELGIKKAEFQNAYACEHGIC
jgi:hypothetical protein